MTAIPLTAGVTRLPRKQVLLGLMGLFVVGNALSALAPTYEVAVATRIDRPHLVNSQPTTATSATVAKYATQGVTWNQ